MRRFIRPHVPNITQKMIMRKNDLYPYNWLVLIDEIYDKRTKQPTGTMLIVNADDRTRRMVLEL